MILVTFGSVMVSVCSDRRPRRAGRRSHPRHRSRGPRLAGAAGLGPFAATGRAAPPPGRPSPPPGRSSGNGASSSRSRRSSERDLVGDELGGVALVAGLVFPLAGLDATLDVDLVALAQALRGPLGLLAPDHDPEPLGLFLPLTLWSRQWRLVATVNWVTAWPLGV